MDLYVRESGPVGAPTIVFLHGGKMSGWSWKPVVQRMQQYHCLVPDLPEFGKSFQQGPFDIARAANAVADLVRSRAGSDRVHIVGLSLGAQVGVQLLATEPKLVDRAVLCGTVINTMPCVRLTQLLMWTFARITGFRWAVYRHGKARHLRIPTGSIDDYREDVRLTTRAKFAHIVVASSGFTLPDGLGQSRSPALFLTGAKEMPFVRRWAAALAQPMPNGVDRVAIGMHHDWPLRYPDLFSRTVDGWLTDSALPAEIALPGSGCR